MNVKTKTAEPQAGASSTEPAAPETAPVPPVAEPVIKRGRGRPRKFPQAEPVAGAADATPKKKPGRPKKRQEFGPDARATLARQLVGLHMIAAHATGIPELLIGEPDGDALAGAVIAVAEEYGLSLSGKTGAALQLFATAAMVYVPRYFAMQARIHRPAPVVNPEPKPDGVTVN